MPAVERHPQRHNHDGRRGHTLVWGLPPAGRSNFVAGIVCVRPGRDWAGSVEILPAPDQRAAIKFKYDDGTTATEGRRLDGRAPGDSARSPIATGKPHGQAARS